MSLHTTASQTVGPFFSIGLEPMVTTVVAGPETPGVHVIIRGHIYDGDGKPIPDALIETWQADANGVYPDPEDPRSSQATSGFRGFGRAPTNDAGEYSLSTIVPGRAPAPDGSLQAPHLVVTIVMRGLLRHVVTRLYFPDEVSNAEDPILTLVPADRRDTIIARRAEGQDGTLVWDVVMQGARETVFFDA